VIGSRGPPLETQIKSFEEAEHVAARSEASDRLEEEPTNPKIYLPLLDNGNGQVMASFMIDHAVAFGGRKAHMLRASDSHANRGMNFIANKFLESDCDVWINIDADIRFTRADVDRLLGHDLPLVYGIYPKKEDTSSPTPCLATFDKAPEPDENGLAEVRRCGRGFMAVKREVLIAMKEGSLTLHPVTGEEIRGMALRYHNHGSDAGGQRIEWDFFPSGVVTGEFSALESPSPFVPKDPDGFPIREWISEDWFFCERARKLGYKIMVDTRIALGHVGQKEYRFGPGQVARTDSHIKTWREIHGWFDYEDLYREIAQQIPDGGKFVEIGCWLGRSIAAMSSFCSELQTPNSVLPALHVVDTFCGEPANEEHRLHLSAHGGNVEKAFRANMAALGVDVQIHSKPSVEAAKDFSDESIDAVFIDGDHSFEAVKQDIMAWLPKVKPGGILCGHDIDEAGVWKAVTRLYGDAFETKGRCWLVRI